MRKEDFTDEELKLLRIIFKGAETILYMKREDNEDNYDINIFYNLKQKLGIFEVLL